MQATEKSPLRWLALAGMVCVLFIMQFSVLITAGIATTIMPEYGLTPAQFGMICNMPFLAGVLFGILTGNLGDRYGIKKMMTIGIVVFILGALWRSMVSTFWPLCIASLVMGYGIAVLNANSTKGIRLWFTGNSMGVAMGVYVCGASIGAGIALKMGPVFSNSAAAFRVCVFLAIIALVAWLLLYRTHPNELGEKEAVSMTQFKSIMTNKNVWLVSIMIFFIFASSTTEQTYVNAALSELGGGDVGTASSIALVSTIAVAIGSIVMPAIIAHFQRFRPVMIGVCVINAVIIVLVYILPFGAATFGLFIIQGAFLGAMLSMGKTVPALLPGIDPANLGAVGGLQSTLQNVGAWIVAGYIIAPICQSCFSANLYMAIYVGAAICSVLAGLTIAFLPHDMPTSITRKLEMDAQAKK